METIFHEKQDGSLCAQHCLNSLLQGPYFSPVDLGMLARKLDDEERQRMAECGENSEEYRRFLMQPSGNMDDSGYFSVQVISTALQVWGLELVPYNSTDERVKNSLKEPHTMNAFICHFKDHWLSIRKIAEQWFNLNSLLPRPERISNTYLSLFLAQLKNDGYSIFVVFGELPQCRADVALKNNTVSSQGGRGKLDSTSIDNDPELQKAMLLSFENTNYSESNNEEDAELKEALELSLMVPGDEEDEDEETLLRKAINLSLQS